MEFEHQNDRLEQLTSGYKLRCFDVLPALFSKSWNIPVAVRIVVSCQELEETIHNLLGFGWFNDARMGTVVQREHVVELALEIQVGHQGQDHEELVERDGLIDGQDFENSMRQLFNLIGALENEHRARRILFDSLGPPDESRGSFPTAPSALAH